MGGVVLALLSVPGSALSTEQLDGSVFFLNTYGVSKTYTISRFRPDGRPDPSKPVIVPTSGHPRADAVAWPTAVRPPEGPLYLYANVRVDAHWRGVALWTSRDGGRSFRSHGIVLKASEVSPEGAGPGHVSVDPRDDAFPFKLWLTALAPNGVGARVVFAESSDGRDWRLRGSVLERGPESYDEEGFGLSFVCRMEKGTWNLFYTTYERGLSHGAAALAQAGRASGPFQKRGVIMRYDGRGTALAQGASLGDRVLRLKRRPRPRPNEAWVVHAGQGQERSEVVTIREARAGIAQLEQPLRGDYPAGARVASVARRKIDPSFVWLAPDGRWRGIFTAYGALPGLTAEFTVATLADHLEGPWRLDRRIPAPRFQARTASHLYSVENPSPVLNGPACSIDGRPTSRRGSGPSGERGRVAGP